MAQPITCTVSSRTGNTRKVADAVMAELQRLGWNVRERERGQAVDTQLVAMFFWCFKSTFDPLNAKLLESMKGKRILVFGTFGGYPDSPYGNKVRANITRAVNQHNECVGVFLSQGKVRLDNVEKRRNLPPEDPHHLDDAGLARVLESQRHPNDDDIRAAVAVLHERLPQLEGGQHGNCAECGICAQSFAQEVAARLADSKTIALGAFH